MSGLFWLLAVVAMSQHTLVEINAALLALDAHFPFLAIWPYITSSVPATANNHRTSFLTFDFLS